ncbi:serine/threonine protein kinase [Streptomyces sp. NBC_01214]|uniref:serine/threonine-protein kinase n=1 Tax=Streptomyces sp. NBC_01214 TaxID=2903777 RepID=UPI00225B3511|nr:serine/threonine-protein kinase [Streptomyces sp. NBC_01214]MCX4808039.1 serine/threonine protein kinase [Streptomyces sp. NBC_01214]
MSTTDDAVLRPLGPGDPQEISGYRLLAKIGEGGMGSVYLSRTRGNQPVALKVIRREFAQEQDFRVRFEREVQAARRVQGYHIVPVLDHDTSGEQPWLATAFVPGLALDDALAAHGPLPLPAVFQLIGCTAQALHSIHAASVVHRDLKPSNILLGSNGPWVIDFGIARATDTTQLTRSGGFIGTPQYMSPEHALGRTVTAATDVFALGLIAAVVATGRHPYGDGAGLSIAAAIANTPQQAPDLSGYPEPLRQLLERCLHSDAAQRPGPAELAEWCGRVAGRELRDFDGWLPEPLTAEIARRERSAQAQAQAPAPSPAQVPPAPVQAPPPPAYAPTQASGPVPSAYAPTQGPGPVGAPHPPSYGAPTAAPSYAPAYAAPAGPAAPAPAARRSRVPLVVGAGVLAVALAAGGTWYLTREEDSGAKQTAGDSKEKPADAPKDAAPAARSGGSAPSASTSASSSAAPSGRTYTAVYKDKPLKLLAPREFGKVNDVDLDFPKVATNGEIGWQDQELAMGYDGVRSSTSFGKSKGPTPEQCETGAATDPIPNRLRESDLTGADSAIVQGDLLCTVTTKGNLAMVKIVSLEPSTDKNYTVPTYITEVTLWKR